MSAFETLFGRLHPLVIHFPIALILLAAALEVVRLKWDRPSLAQLVTFLLIVGAAGAALASITGWIFAVESHPRPSLAWMLSWHRWLGVATTVLAGLAAWVSRRLANAPSSGARWCLRLSVWLTAALLVVTAHLGALMVWGEDYFDPSS
jgi:uncharacterized membrane protein